MILFRLSSQWTATEQSIQKCVFVSVISFLFMLQSHAMRADEDPFIVLP